MPASSTTPLTGSKTTQKAKDRMPTYQPRQQRTDTAPAQSSSSAGARGTSHTSHTIYDTDSSHHVLPCRLHQLSLPGHSHRPQEAIAAGSIRQLPTRGSCLGPEHTHASLKRPSATHQLASELITCWVRAVPCGPVWSQCVCSGCGPAQRGWGWS